MNIVPTNDAEYVYIKGEMGWLVGAQFYRSQGAQLYKPHPASTKYSCLDV